MQTLRRATGTFVPVDNNLGRNRPKLRKCQEVSEERMSRLQKWILMMLWSYAEGSNLKVKELKACARFGGKREMRRFEGKAFRDGHRSQKNSVDVSFSRSLRTLERRDLIFTYAADPLKEIRGTNVFDDVGNLSSIALTEEGEVKARELLNVKNSKLNNRKRREPH